MQGRPAHTRTSQKRKFLRCRDSGELLHCAWRLRPASGGDSGAGGAVRDDLLSQAYASGVSAASACEARSKDGGDAGSSGNKLRFSTGEGKGIPANLGEQDKGTDAFRQCKGNYSYRKRSCRGCYSIGSNRNSVWRRLFQRGAAGTEI